MKAVFGFLKELGGDVKIDLCGSYIHVAHVSGQNGQLRIHIFSLFIPLDETIGCIGMAKIMKSGRIRSFFANITLLN